MEQVKGLEGIVMVNRSEKRKEVREEKRRNRCLMVFNCFKD